MNLKFENQRLIDLKEKTNDLRQELTAILGNWFYLKNILYSQIELKYHQIFGDIEKNIEDLSSELKNLKYQKYKTNYSNESKKYFSNIEELNNIAETIFNKIENSFENSKIPQISINIEYEVAYIYRQIVKKMHPDTNNDKSLFEKYWHNVQDAYQSKNIVKLRLFHKLICFDDYLALITHQNHERVLIDELNELEKNINLEKMKINRLMNQEPFVFMNKLNDENWINQRKEILNKKCNNLKNRVNNLQNKIELNMN